MHGVSDAGWHMWAWADSNEWKKQEGWKWVMQGDPNEIPNSRIFLRGLVDLPVLKLAFETKSNISLHGDFNFLSNRVQATLAVLYRVGACQDMPNAVYSWASAGFAYGCGGRQKSARGATVTHPITLPAPLVGLGPPGRRGSTHRQVFSHCSFQLGIVNWKWSDVICWSKHRSWSAGRWAVHGGHFLAMKTIQFVSHHMLVAQHAKSLMTQIVETYTINTVLWKICNIALFVLYGTVLHSVFKKIKYSPSQYWENDIMLVWPDFPV